MNDFSKLVLLALDRQRKEVNFENIDGQHHYGGSDLGIACCFIYSRCILLHAQKMLQLPRQLFTNEWNHLQVQGQRPG